MPLDSYDIDVIVCAPAHNHEHKPSCSPKRTLVPPKSAIVCVHVHVHACVQVQHVMRNESSRLPAYPKVG